MGVTPTKRLLTIGCALCLAVAFSSPYPSSQDLEIPAPTHYVITETFNDYIDHTDILAHLQPLFADKTITEDAAIYIPGPTIANAPDPHYYSEEALYVLAQMLAGECYDYNLEDQRNAAIVVCNRVDAGGYYAPYNTVAKVIQGTGFYGWAADNIPSENNLKVAAEVLTDWYMLRHNQPIERPWHNYMSFGASGSDYNNYY